MGNSTHRPKHKKKLAARKNQIQQQKNMYKKFMDKQLANIQEQIRNKQTTNIELAPPADDSSVVLTQDPGHDILVEDAKIIEDIIDGTK